MENRALSFDAIAQSLTQRRVVNGECRRDICAVRVGVELASHDRAGIYGKRLLTRPADVEDVIVTIKHGIVLVGARDSHCDNVEVVHRNPSGIKGLLKELAAQT